MPKGWRETGDEAASDGAAKKIPLEKLVEAVNVAELLDDEQLAKIGSDVFEGYTMDMASRKQWEVRNAEGIKLALQVVENKSFPWVGCSNVKFPLLTIAALQFLSRVSILTKGRNIVACDFVGVDQDGEKFHRAKRISGHMSWQLVEEDTEWIDDDEKAKLSSSLIGCAFKKSSYDPVEGITISEYVPAPNLVVDYFTKSFKKANRVTHLIPMSDNDLQERFRSGTFLEVDEHYGQNKGDQIITNVMLAARDESQGTRRPEESDVTPFSVLEQHTWLDLDGDGYKEPYIVFVKAGTKQVLRIVARFFDKGDVHRANDMAVKKYKQMSDESKVPEFKAKWAKQSDEYKNSSTNHVIRIDAQQNFNKIPFIPSPDGGFYDLGFISLLGPTNEAVNTAINQLMDKGTMGNLGGGFLGRGVKMKGGASSFAPGEWKPVDSAGDDLRKNIMPLPVGQADPILFELLKLLIGYGERISGSTDIMSGVSPGQNTPAETSRNTIEQGMKIFSGIYGRQYRSFKRELQIRYDLNRLFLTSSPKFEELTEGDGAMIAKDDYTKLPLRIYPSADPAVTSDEQRKQKAALVYGLSKESPLLNKYLAEKQFLEANDIMGIDQLCPDPQGPNALPPPFNPKIKLEQDQLEFEKQKHHDTMMIEVVRLQAEKSLNDAKIMELQAKAEKETAEANGVDIGHRIALMNAQVAVHRAQSDNIEAALGVLQKSMQQKHEHALERDQFNHMKESSNGKEPSNTAGKTGVGA